LPDLPALREEFAPRHADCPAVSVVMPPASSYDTLLVEEVSV